VKRFLLPEKTTLSLCLSGFLRSAACPPTSAVTTASPSLPRTLYSTLSKLAVWWLRLGMGIERIQPGHPQQNGRHERMHLTLKKQATKPAATNFLQQQARFDKFIEVFNNERPHQALDMKCPVEVYQPSPRPYSGLPDIDYPLHDKTIVVTRCGRICLGNKKINFSQVFAGQAVGIKEVHDDIWLVSFMDYDLGYFDLETRVLEPLENPFGPKVSPM
jgi:putative transposase